MSLIESVWNILILHPVKLTVILTIMFPRIFGNFLHCLLYTSAGRSAYNEIVSELAGHREGRVGVAWHNNVPMNFVADDFYAVPEADFAHPMQFLRAPDAPYRVVWAAENQQFAVAFRGNLFQKFKIDGIGAVLIHQRTGLHMAAAVSYTHLDVYKRQV